MSGQVDQRTDLWAVGVMMYEMLAGRRPFSGDTIERVLAAILFRSPFPLPQDCPIEPGLERLVTRALAKDPDERFQTAQEFLEALRAADTTVSVAVQAGAGSTPSIAVLPFADMSEARDQEYFCEGMAEELINALTKLPSIRVAARTSSFRFKHQAVDVRDIGRELNVTSLVEGSVRKFGEHIRIAARLTEVSDGYERWAEQYDREAGNVFLVQDEIARAIVDQLEVRLSGLQSPTLIAPSTQDVDAYKLYLQGRHYWNHRYPGFIEKAIRCFEGAIARDATYALAYTGLADAYVVLGAYGLMEPALSMSKAKQAAERAVALNDGLAEAHHSTALVAWYGDRSWLGTERAFRRALELNPASGVAHAHASVMLGYHGEFDEAVREAEQARQLEPMSAVIGYYTGNAFMLAGQLDEALDEVERSVDLDPNFGMAGWQKVWILRAHGRHQDALVEAERVAALTKRQCIFLATLGVAYAGVGDVGRATAVLDEVVAGADDNHVSPLAAAMICASLGSTDWALDHLERAVAKRVPLLVLLPLHPVFQPLWENPRFEDLTRRIGIWT
jgi:serine/threonine-protein kinase